MLRNVKIAIAISVAVLGSWFTAADGQAGWGHHHGWGHHGWGHHHHGHHHHGHYGGGYYGRGLYSGVWGSWGYPRYGWGSSYTSLRIGIGWPGYTYDYPRRYPYIYPGSLSSFDYYSPYGSYPSIFGTSIASYYAPYYASSSYAPYTSSYYASSGGCAPSVGCAPVIAPSCCDPCAGYPAATAPATGVPSYTPDAAPAVPSEQLAPPNGTAPSVKTLLPNWIPSSTLTRAGGAQPAAGQGSGAVAGARLTTTGHGSVQNVAAAKLVTPDIATDLVPLSQPLLQAADAIFASGDYQQAAAAYARLTLRYGNHDELAVRRFVALVASGDCDQAAVMFETASLAEQPLLASALPSGGLNELYGPAAAERDKHVDYLAAYALKHPDDGLALAMVGTWLELDGQASRAQVFMKGAAALAPGERRPTDSAHLVATDISQ